MLTLTEQENSVHNNEQFFFNYNGHMKIDYICDCYTLAIKISQTQFSSNLYLPKLLIDKLQHVALHNHCSLEFLQFYYYTIDQFV